MSRPAEKTCIYRHPNGRKCEAYRLKDRPYCWAHDPEYTPAAFERRSKGIQTTNARNGGLTDQPAPPADGPPRTRADLLAYLQETMEMVRNGRLDHRRGDVVMKLGKLALENIEELEEETAEAEADAEIAKLGAV